IGRALIQGDVLDGALIRVELGDGALRVTHENPVEVEEGSADGTEAGAPV
ncbi:MAG: hypothetical protein JRJ16_08810, partial [Deltaproteobacteria bacterium]|nr:hypothetical protein [Deltaproteobacteria bacterium]